MLELENRSGETIRLIRAITGNESSTSGVERGSDFSTYNRRTPLAPGRYLGVKGAAAIGFGLVFGIASFAATAYLGVIGRTEPVTPRVEDRMQVPIVETSMSPGEPTARVTGADDRRPTEVLHVALHSGPRKAAFHKSRLATPAAPGVEKASYAGLGEVAVPLTGAALEAALAEDRIKTRALNLNELVRPRPMVRTPG